MLSNLWQDDNDDKDSDDDESDQEEVDDVYEEMLAAAAADCDLEPSPDPEQPPVEHPSLGEMEEFPKPEEQNLEGNADLEEQTERQDPPAGKTHFLTSRMFHKPGYTSV